MAQGTCTVEGCESPAFAKAMCRPHYRLNAIHGDPLYVRTAKTCRVHACERPYFSTGYCEMHHGRVRRTGNPGGAERVRAQRRAECLVDGCDLLSSARGLCPRHYQRFVRFGDPLHVPQRACPETLVRACKWCGIVFDSGTDGRRRFCSEECRRIVDLLASSLGRYSLTVAEYRLMWVAQNGTCRICETGASGRSEMLAVDHDHACCSGNRSCGKCVRGLLCDRCNNGLGCLNDDPDLLRKAAEYVERTRRVHT
jgi:hypothetical protein